MGAREHGKLHYQETLTAIAMEISSNSYPTKSGTDRVEGIPLNERPEEPKKGAKIYLAAAAVALGASGPASAPSGTTPEEFADSPTWWKSGNTKDIS